MSGHSKWSTIKRKKGAIDAQRGKIFTKLVKEITIAARNGGGDPSGNHRLRRAMDAAKAQNVPGDNVERAIKRGTGELEGVEYEELTYEGVGPSGTLFLLPAVTDNRNRTAPELRQIFDKHNGQLGATGSAAWAFDEFGVIRIPATDGEGGSLVNEETLLELAVGAGADDLKRDGGDWMVLCSRDALESVRDAVETAAVPVSSAALEYLPKTPKEVDGPEAEVLMNLVDALEEHDDVQEVFSDFDLSEAALAKLAE